MFEYQTRDIGGDICYYKRKNGTQLWSFINEKEYKNGGSMKNVNIIGGGKMNPKMEELAKRLQKEISSDRGIDNVASVVDEYNLSSYTPMGNYMENYFKVGDIVTVDGHPAYDDLKGKTFKVSNAEINKEGEIEILEYTHTSTDAIRIAPRYLYIQNEIQFPTEPIVVDYSSYSEMEDLEVHGKSAFVIANDSKTRKIIIEYVDTGDMETIEYKDGGKLMEGREILYKDENVALQHNKVSDHYSVINPNTGAFMEKGGEINKMRKIRVKKYWSDKYMPSVKHIYYDKSNNKYYFLDFENDVMELRNEHTLGAFAEYLKENDIKLAKGGSLKRSNNSPMLRYVNFEDGWHINLTKLTSSMNQNGKPYKGNNKYGISRVGGEQGQEVWEFETLNEADTKFNELVELGKTYSKIEKQGEAKGNYKEGGEIGKSEFSDGIGNTAFDSVEKELEGKYKDYASVGEQVERDMHEYTNKWYAEGGKIYDETNYNANEQVISTKKTNISNLDTRLKPFSQDKKRYKVKIIRGKGMRIDKVEVYQKNFDKWRLFKTYTQKSKGNTYAEGGEIIEINEDGSNLPKPLYELFGELDEDEDTYKEMERLRLKANELGYDFDYDLSGQPTEFWKTNKMAKGGSIKSNWFKGELSFLNW